MAEPAADPDRFDAAVEAFRKRVPMDREAWDLLTTQQRERAFMVSRVSEARVIQSTFDAIDRAVSEGLTLEDFKDAVAADLIEAWGSEIPGRLECLVGGTKVSGAVVRAAHRRWYEGNVCEVVTGTGRNFTATPNHPMLTRRGWVLAGSLRDGDDLVGYARQEHIGLGRDNDRDHGQPTISEVFDSFASARPSKRIESTALDFHGDGIDGHVDIAAPDGLLSIGRFPALREPLKELVFSDPNLASTSFCPSCLHLVVWSKRCGFCDRPVVHAGPAKSCADRAMASVQALSNSIRAFSGKIPGNDLIYRYVAALARRLSSSGVIKLARVGDAPNDSCSPCPAGNRAGGNSNLRADLCDADPRSVQFDRVVSNRVRHFSGHVFNLSTVHGYYGIDGLYTGNTIFRTNVMTAYGEGRHAIMSSPTVKQARPYWRFDDAETDRECDTCSECGGTILPVDDPWWKTHQVPLHHNCECIITALSQEEAEDEGIDTKGPRIDADEGFGDKPSQEGTNWDFDLSGLDPELRSVVEDALKEAPERPEPVEKPIEQPKPEPRPEPMVEPRMPKAVVEEDLPRSRPREEEAPAESMDERQPAERIEQERKDFASEHVDKKNESAVILNEQGERVFIKQGKNNKVSFESDELRKMENGHLVHNHPSGNSLSPTDLNLAVERDMRSMTAVGRDPYSGNIREYSFTRPEKGWPSKDEIAIAQAGAEKEAFDHLKIAIKYQAMTKQEANFEWFHEVWKRTQKRLDIGYKEIVRGKR